MAGVIVTPRMRFRMLSIAAGAAIALTPALVIGTPVASASTATHATANAATCTNEFAISYGSPSTVGSIADAGQVDCYLFKAKAGSRLLVRVVTTDGTLVANTEVDGPTGTTYCGPGTTTDQTCSVPKKGNQVIAIQDASGTNTGGYTVSVQVLKKPLGCADLSFGDPSNSSTITVPGTVDCYTFRAAAGSQLLTRLVTTSGALVPTVQSFSPTGTSICGPSAALESNCRLVAGGSQTLFVRDSDGPNTGGYSLYAQLTKPVGCTTIKFGKAVQSSITSAGQTGCYKFPGVNGDHIRVTVAATSGTLVTDTQVFKPNGTSLCEISGTPEQTCRLTAAGTHTVYVSDVTGMNTGNYTIYVQDLNAPLNCTAIEYEPHNHVTPASISFPGAENCFTFQGTGDTGAHLNVDSTGGTWTPTFDMYTPAGNDFVSGYCDKNATDERCFLKSTGTYLIIVRDATAQNTGTYNYTLGERTFS